MNTNCPGCGRAIDEEDDVVPKQGPMGTELWHEECVVTPKELDEIVEVVEVVEPREIVPSQPESLVVTSATSKEKKVPAKKAKKEEPVDPMVAALLEEIRSLRADVNALKSQPNVVSVAKKVSVKGQPRPNVKYKLLGYPSEGFPPQCLRVMRCLAQSAPEGGEMNEVQIYDALMGPDSTLGAWNYNQTPYHIFKYYSPQMRGADFMRGPFNV